MVAVTRMFHRAPCYSALPCQIAIVSFVMGANCLWFLNNLKIATLPQPAPKESLMRLTCPTCTAQYEVPDDVIPSEGRDVQCSDCGTTWFQEGAHAAGVQPVQPTYDAPETKDVDAEDYAHAPEHIPETPAPQTPDTTQTQASAPEIAVSAEALEDEGEGEAYSEDTDEGDDSDMPLEEEAEPQQAPQFTRPKRTLDASVADILREEAERESALRAAEAGTLETQPDLGLAQPSAEDTEQRARQTRDRMAKLRGDDPNAAEDDQPPTSRGGLFPDIEEINSSLRGGYETAEPGTTQGYDGAPGRQRGGFVRGFTIVILIAVAAALTYQNAGRIAASVPEATPFLQAYVDWVDETRFWLHTQVEELARAPKP